MVGEERLTGRLEGHMNDDFASDAFYHVLPHCLSVWGRFLLKLGLHVDVAS